jgi:hypothetical protein
MSIRDEQDLIERLDRAFGAVQPRPAPIEAAARQGRVIRVRRRISAAAGLAVVVAAGVCVPLLLHSPPTPAAGPVTVRPPGPGAPYGLIASGTAGGHRWRVLVERRGVDGTGRGNQCFMALGVLGCGPVTRASASAPIQLTGTSAGQVKADYGPVARTVSYVTVRLATGQLLTLQPVTVGGIRYVAFAAPLHTAISRVTGYSGQRALITAVPFSSPTGLSIFGLWLAPGQRGLARATRVIAAGTSAGQAWSVTAYLGPWGQCLASRAGGAGGATSTDCIDALPPLGTSVSGWGVGPPRVVYGPAAAPVTHVVVTLAGGGTIRVPAVRVGSQKFFGFALAPGQRAIRWGAYNAARQLVASGGPVGSS